jgi:hypothetical protein
VSTLTVVYDACVLYPAPLRDFLLQLALTDLFRAKWTAEIHEEWISNLLEKRPDLSRTRLERTRDLMNAHVRDCLVINYEPLIPSIILPDENDRHVVAAAIQSHSDAIVTYNLKDFPESAIAPLGITAIHPDDFIYGQMGLSSEAVCQTARLCRERLKSPPKSVAEYLQTLAGQGLPQTVAALQSFQDLI